MVAGFLSSACVTAAEVIPPRAAPAPAPPVAQPSAPQPMPPAWETAPTSALDKATTLPVSWLVSRPSPPVPLRHDGIDVGAWQFGNPELAPSDVYPTVRFNETAVIWAGFLVQVHNRLHRVFADEYLASLDALPPTSPLNAELSVRVGLVIEPNAGELARMYVSRSSAEPEFDVAALAAFSRSFPMPVPTELASADGRVYFEWELKRGREACGTTNARPLRFGPPLPAAGP